MYFNQTQVAEIFKVSRQTIVNWEKEGMPVDRTGKTPKYFPIEIMKWKYKEDWVYYFDKLINGGNHETI